MKFEYESLNKNDYLTELEEVDYSHALIQLQAHDLFNGLESEIEIVQKAYDFVRDEISHSWDIQSNIITRTASETLLQKEGICYAKSNLLAALLRSQNIPTGFCYQRLTLGDTPETGYCIHALNAVYLSAIERWIRLDARGNKEGIQAEFSMDEERLAFPVREEYGEKDYPIIYSKPNRKTMDVLLTNDNCKDMYLHGLPTEI